MKITLAYAACLEDRSNLVCYREKLRKIRRIVTKSMEVNCQVRSAANIIRYSKISICQKEETNQK